MHNIEKEVLKLQKQYKWEYVRNVEDLTNHDTFSIRDFIQGLQSYNSENYRIKYVYDYDCQSHSFQIEERLLETDREFENRKKRFILALEKENKAFLEKEEIERLEYERLKAKYETN